MRNPMKKLPRVTGLCPVCKASISALNDTCVRRVDGWPQNVHRACYPEEKK